jgi:3-methyladenine DNA glycosylase AlkD
MHPWIENTREALVPIANDTDASFMKAYLRGQFEFYGIKSGPRREALKPLFSKDNLPSIDEMGGVVDQLWALPQREFQLVAVDLLIKTKTKLPVSTLDDVERWITTKSWWDTVDMLATHIVGTLFKNFPSETALYIQKWRQSEDFWLRRTALLYQLKFKTDTDVSLLLEVIKENKLDNEFFIQKAIGWVLREYSKTNAELVIKFIEQENIQGLAKREGLKWINKRNA